MQDKAKNSLKEETKKYSYGVIGKSALDSLKEQPIDYNAIYVAMAVPDSKAKCMHIESLFIGNKKESVQEFDEKSSNLRPKRTLNQILMTMYHKTIYLSIVMLFTVSFIVNKYTNEITAIDVLYSVNAKKEPAGSSKSPKVSTLSTGSEISISDLLDYVNKYHLDVLPKMKSLKNEFKITDRHIFRRNV